MRNLTRYVLSVAAAALFTGCGGVAEQTGLPIGALGALPQTSTAPPLRADSAFTKRVWTHEVLYAFDLKPENDGTGEPLGGLLDVNGTLYGTTYLGRGSEHGRPCRAGAYRSCGTVYTIGTSGAYQTIHAFSGGKKDGALPGAGLIDVDGTLYGTTEGGGSACNCGTVYSISPTGVEKVLYRFAGGADGADPGQGDLLYLNGRLFGTTSSGGSSGCDGAGCGTVYSVTTSGEEHVLHSFGSSGDGAEPLWGLINIGKAMYGTTVVGGAHVCGSAAQRGCGTVFRIDTSGAEKVLYSFAGGSDGAAPYGGLAKVRGTLYGTTALGGAGSCGGTQSSCGTVYSVTTSGVEKVLHSFRGGSDSLNPVGSLIDVNGKLYGVTAGYIALAPRIPLHGCATCGTVFSVTTSGKEQVLYNFAGGADGSQPDAPLIDVSGTLYGTTREGGKDWGTVFSLAP
jgi:uncharacterized repeat protein (TIGR03803 family)